MSSCSILIFGEGVGTLPTISLSEDFGSNDIITVALAGWFCTAGGAGVDTGVGSEGSSSVVGGTGLIESSAIHEPSGATGISGLVTRFSPASGSVSRSPSSIRELLSVVKDSAGLSGLSPVPPPVAPLFRF